MLKDSWELQNRNLTSRFNLLSYPGHYFLGKLLPLCRGYRQCILSLANSNFEKWLWLRSQSKKSDGIGLFVKHIINVMVVLKWWQIRKYLLFYWQEGKYKSNRMVKCWKLMYILIVMAWTLVTSLMNINIDLIWRYMWKKHLM